MSDLLISGIIIAVGLLMIAIGFFCWGICKKAKTIDQSVQEKHSAQG